MILRLDRLNLTYLVVQHNKKKVKPCNKQRPIHPFPDPLFLTVSQSYPHQLLKISCEFLVETKKYIYVLYIYIYVLYNIYITYI